MSAPGSESLYCGNVSSYTMDLGGETLCTLRTDLAATLMQLSVSGTDPVLIRKRATH